MQQIVHGRALRGLVMVVGLGIPTGTNIASALAASAGCVEINRGTLNAEVTASQSTTKDATIATGEMLYISVTTRGTAAIDLVGGAGSTARVYSGPSISSLAVSAPGSGTYSLRYTAGSAAPATIRISCASDAEASARSAFLTRRNDLLTAQDPDRTRIDRPQAPVVAPLDPQAAAGTNLEDVGSPKPAAFSVSLSELAAAAKPGAKQEPSILDFWIEGRYQPYQAADVSGAPSEGNLGVMYVGSKYMLGPDIMLGALAQLDTTVESTARLSRDATASGWMVGPYMSVRFGPGVVFDGRAAWGASESSVPGIGLSEPEAGRRLVRGKLRGTRDIGGWTFAPSVGLSYVEDGAQAELTTEAAPPKGQGRLDVLPEIKRRFNVNSETYVEPRAAVGGFVTFDELNKINPAEAAGAAPVLHMKAEAGVAVGVKDGMNLEATGGVETGGATTPDTYSGRFQLNVPLGK